MTIDSARRCAGISGIAVAVLFAAGNALWAFDMPDSGASAAEVADYYRDTQDGIIVGGSLSLVSIAVFVLFAAALRRVLAEAEGDDLLPMTAFGGALLCAATGVAAETINLVGALRADDGALTDELAHALWEVARAFGSTASSVGLAVFALATAAVALRTRLVLPRWLAVGTGIIGVALLTPLSQLGEVGGGALVLLTLAIGVVLLRTPSAR